METTVVNGVPQGPTATITVGASPFTWQNPESVRVLVMMGALGAVTLTQISADGVTFVDAGLGCGHYHLNPGWKIKTTYIAVPPTMSYTPA